MKNFFLTLVMTLILTVGCAASALAAGTGNLIGHVNVQRVFRNYPDMQTTMSAINLERQRAENEFKEKAASLDEKGKRELGEKLSERVQKKEESLLNPIRSSISKAIAEVAKSHGIENVVDSSAMVYGGMDLTQEVMEYISKGK